MKYPTKSADRQPASKVEGEVLLAYAAHGDAASLQAVFTQVYPVVHRLVLRLVGDPVLANDLTQDTFLRVLASASRYDERGRFRSWLCQIAVNEVRQYWRRRRRTPAISPLDGLVAELTSRGIGVAADVAWREQQVDLHNALMRLNPELRLPLVLHYDQALAFRDIAQVLDVPRATAHDRCKRGLAALRKDLRARGRLRALQGWTGVAGAVPAGTNLLLHWRVAAGLVAGVGFGAWWFVRRPPADLRLPPRVTSVEEAAPPVLVGTRPSPPAIEAKLRRDKSPLTSAAEPNPAAPHAATSRHTRVRLELPAGIATQGLEVMPRASSREMLLANSIRLNDEHTIELPLAMWRRLGHGSIHLDVASRRAALHPVATANLELTDSESPQLVVRATERPLLVGGRVLGDQGAALAGVFVFVVDPADGRGLGGSARTDSEGRFRIHMPLVESLQTLGLCVTSGEYRRSRAVPFRSGQSDLVVKLSGRASGLHVMCEGPGARWCCVRVHGVEWADEDESRRTALRAPEQQEGARHVFQRLPPGTATVSVHVGRDRAPLLVKEGVALVAGEIAVLMLRVPDHMTVHRLAVRDADGQPVGRVLGRLEGVETTRLEGDDVIGGPGSIQIAIETGVKRPLLLFAEGHAPLRVTDPQAHQSVQLARGLPVTLRFKPPIGFTSVTSRVLTVRPLGDGHSTDVGGHAALRDVWPPRKAVDMDRMEVDLVLSGPGKFYIEFGGVRALPRVPFTALPSGGVIEIAAPDALWQLLALTAPP